MLWQLLLKFVKLMRKPCTWFLADKGIGIHAQVQGIAEKQNKKVFHFEKLQKQKETILPAEFQMHFLLALRVIKF